MSTIIESIEQRQLRRVPRFAPGDRVRVHFQVVEGSRKRTQVFEGVVIARRGSGARETFTVRKQSFGVGVERTFPVHSPKIERLEVVAKGDVRRAKLYYLRGRVGRRAKVAERRWGIEDELVIAEDAEAVDSEGVAQSEADAMPEIEGEEGERRGTKQEQMKHRQVKRSRPRRLQRRGRRSRSRRRARPTRNPPRSPRRRPRALRHPPDPQADNGARGAHRAGRDRRAGGGSGASDPGVRRQALPDPLRLDGADPRPGPARPGRPGHLPVHRSRDR